MLIALRRMRTVLRTRPELWAEPPKVSWRLRLKRMSRRISFTCDRVGLNRIGLFFLLERVSQTGKLDMARSVNLLTRGVSPEVWVRSLNNNNNNTHNQGNRKDTQFTSMAYIHDIYIHTYIPLSILMYVLIYKTYLYTM